MNTLTILLWSLGPMEMLLIAGLAVLCLYFFVLKPSKEKREGKQKEVAREATKETAKGFDEFTEHQLLQRILMNTEQSTQQVAFLYWVTIIGLVLGVAGLLYAGK